MSLYYDFTTVPNPEIIVKPGDEFYKYFDRFSLQHYNLWKKNPEDQSIRHPKPIIERLSFLSISVELGEINANNVDEWCWRIGFLTEIGFNMTVDEWNPKSGDFDEVKIQRHHIESCIGLSTNVNSVSRDSFIQMIIEKKVRTTRAIK